MITKKSGIIAFVLSALMLALCVNLPAQDKKLGRHTVAEWHAIIDSTWGPGLPTATKLYVFDFFWNLIDREYSGFPYLDVNWDSLKTHYRPEVEAGVSRGRFAAIMHKLYFSLQDIHAWIVDVGLVSPNPGSFIGAPTFDYGPGTPLFWPSGWGPCGVFGAALTPLPDSSLLVYKSIDAHPLGLLPGDIILGYDRIPWKQLYKEALAAELPLGFGWRWGTTPRSMTHSLLSSAGNNWSMFDTVDVVKYATGDTVHLATSSLAGLTWNRIFSSEQLPVPGVKLPDHLNGEYITYGVIEGTSIGYVYVQWWNAEQSVPFRSALSDLLNVKKVTALILDFRFNVGSLNSINAPDAGLDLLFNESPGGSSRWLNAIRVQGSDHFAFSRSSPFDQTVVMQPDYFDRPIAVLTGPASWSMGDMHSFRLRSHPMVRFFGLPTNGAFCVPEKIPLRGEMQGSWYYQWPLGQMESLVNNEGLLMHKGFPVDEEVWLTRDGVAKGEDDVVKRALEWITTVTHAHSIALDHYYVPPQGSDSVTVTAKLANPLLHTAVISAIVSDGATVHDSVLLYNDGLHGDGASGDSLWGARFLAPPVEGSFDIALRTDDLTEGTSRRISRAAFLSTAGPLALDTVHFQNDPDAGQYIVTPFVRNKGATSAIERGTLRMICPDPSVYSINPAVLPLPTIAAGDISAANGKFIINYDPSSFKGHFHVTFELGIDGHTCWIVPDVIDAVAEGEPLPSRYALEQNYPNPFNPTTGVRFQVPGVCEVKIAVYDLLGREVAVLVNERKAPGSYEVSFDASGFASGVYICRLTAGSFVQSRTMILLR